MTQFRDPIPYDRVAELISDAEPAQQSAVLHDAWRGNRRPGAGAIELRDRGKRVSRRAYPSFGA